MKRPGLNTMILLFTLFTTLDSLSSETSVSACVLDIEFRPSENQSTCEDGSWGGFLNGCCDIAFDAYLYALALRTNQTTHLFLNFTEQKSCLVSMQSIEKDVSVCGIQKLTSGAGADGCSNYNATDVVNKLGARLKILGEDCNFFGTDYRFDQVCSACLRRWEEINSSSDNGKVLVKNEVDICRFAVLTMLTSNRIGDKKWVQEVYKCLARQNVTIDEVGGINGNHKSLSSGLWILLGALMAIAVIVSLAAWIFFTRKIREIFLEKKGGLNDVRHYTKITVEEVYQATNNLDASNFIGQGSAGKVYKGKLSNGQHVAIKHIIKDSHAETFIREVKTLSHVRHPNLVDLIGYCEARDQCFLVYELCSNGNLSEWLFEITIIGKERSLSWIERLKIAIDCARGLHFLHTYPGGRIVHRDIKPANILITAEFQAKLSDFGLSKVIEIGRSFVRSEVRGTLGYVDPEYRKNGHVNASGDVYSFGIVVLQLLSGKRAINLKLKKPMSLDRMARFVRAGGDRTEFADPSMGDDYSVEAFDSVLKLALSCTGSGVKQKRPSMHQVLSGLQEALHISTKNNSFVYFQAPLNA